MTKRRVVVVVVATMALIFVGVIAYQFLMGKEAATRDAIGIQVEQNIRAVYQIKTDEKKGKVAAGLHYLKKLVDTYDSLGVEPAQRHIHGVFHGEAGHFLLDDATYAAATMTKGEAENPNAALVEELVERGVHLEICAQTMDAKGWDRSDLLDDVNVVVGAYPRIIDLQLSGYAYVRF